MNVITHLYLKPEYDDLKPGCLIPGFGVIEESTERQVKIASLWYDKRAVIPVEKLSATRIKKIIERPDQQLTARDIRYLRQIEQEIYKPYALRSDALNSAIGKLTGKSLRDEPNLVNSILFTIERFYELRGQKKVRHRTGISRGQDIEKGLER